MEEKLKAALEAGEKLIWSARPEKFELLDKTNKKTAMTKLIVSVGIAVILALIYIFSVKVDIKWGLIVIILALGCCVPLGFFSDSRKIAGKMLYAFTDKRFITVIEDQIREVPFEAVLSAQFKKDEDGHTSILVGKDVQKKKASAWRAAATTGVRMNEEGGICDGYAMYAVPEADKVKALLKEYVTVI